MPAYGDKVDAQNEYNKIMSGSQPKEPPKRSHQLLEQLLEQAKETNRNLGILAKAMLVIGEQQGKKSKKVVDKVASVK